MRAGTISVRAYGGGDAADLFTALDDERAWEHIPRAIPVDGTQFSPDVWGRGSTPRSSGSSPR
jgi:hypothetical protein